ncbi:response regulator transcription factor, partial [Streptomyces roseoviridis]
LLTERELLILRRVARGDLLREIGADLYLSTNGVHSVLSRTFGRLGATSTVNAVHRAHQLGLLDENPPSVEMPQVLVEVLELVAEGCTNSEIGRRTGRSEYWAAEQVRSIRRRLGARDRAHAVALGIAAGVVRPPKGRGTQVA